MRNEENQSEQDTRNYPARNISRKVVRPPLVEGEKISLIRAHEPVPLSQSRAALTSLKPDFDCELLPIQAIALPANDRTRSRLIETLFFGGVDFVVGTAVETLDEHHDSRDVGT